MRNKKLYFMCVNLGDMYVAITSDKRPDDENKLMCFQGNTDLDACCKALLYGVQNGKDMKYVKHNTEQEVQDFIEKYLSK